MNQLRKASGNLSRVLFASRHGEQLRSAMASRDIIGQAKGIVIERFNIDAVRAFELLRQLSHTDNVPLAVIAQRIIDTRGD